MIRVSQFVLNCQLRPRLRLRLRLRRQLIVRKGMSAKALQCSLRTLKSKFSHSLSETASDKVAYWAVLDSKKGEKEDGANGEDQNDGEGGGPAHDDVWRKVKKIWQWLWKSPFSARMIMRVNV